MVAFAATPLMKAFAVAAAATVCIRQHRRVYHATPVVVPADHYSAAQSVRVFSWVTSRYNQRYLLAIGCDSGDTGASGILLRTYFAVQRIKTYNCATPDQFRIGGLQLPLCQP